MDVNEDAIKLAVGTGGGITALGWVWRVLRRRLSRDGVEFAKDRAEINLIDVIQLQAKNDRDRAERAEKERNEALVTIGSMTGKIEALQARLDANHEALAQCRKYVERVKELAQRKNEAG